MRERITIIITRQTKGGTIEAENKSDLDDLGRRKTTLGESLERIVVDLKAQLDKRESKTP